MSEMLEKKAEKQRMVGLDLFRIMAAFVIFLFHSGIVACEYWIFQPFVKMGPIFMTGFFMLSGFSLYYSYQFSDLTKIASIKKFYLKRAASVLPLYWFICVMYGIFLSSESLLQKIVLIPIDISGIHTAFNTLYLYSHFGTTWFISCILFCYLFFPFMSECVKQLSVRARVILMISAGFILLYSSFIVDMFEQESIYPNPLFRIIEFFIGIILASISREYSESRLLKGLVAKKGTICMELIILLGAVTEGIRLGIGVGDYMLYNWICLPIFCLLLTGLAQAEFPILKKSKVVRYCSSISYAFYLAQILTWPLINKMVDITGKNSSQFKSIVSFLICMVISILMHEFVEKPCKKIWLRISDKAENKA